MDNNDLSLEELEEGTELVQIKKTIKQRNINLYAEASKDFNPVHIDEEFAKNSPLGGTVAHGMLILEYVNQMMTNSFGESWFTGGKLNVRFKGAARPRDIITVTGKISKLNDSSDCLTINCVVAGTNENGTQVVTGNAALTVNK